MVYHSTYCVHLLLYGVFSHSIYCVHCYSMVCFHWHVVYHGTYCVHLLLHVLTCVNLLQFPYQPFQLLLLYPLCD